MAYKSLSSISVSDIESLGIARDHAATLHQSLTQLIGTDAPATWQNITTNLLNPEFPFSFHQMLYYGCFKDYGPDPPAWIPDPENVTLTNVGRLLERRGKEFLGSAYKDPITSFADFQKFSVSNPEVYWKTVLDEMNISFSKPPECILRDNPNEDGSSSYPSGRWLPGASINPAQNCLNLNGTRSLNDTVIIWRDELQDDLPLQRMTLEELRQEVWLVAYALESLGLEKGSAIAIDMPMNCKSVVIYLAIVLAGYVVVSIADSFAAREISTRLKISNAKVIFTQDAKVSMLGVIPSLVRSWRNANSTSGYDWSAIRCFASTGEASNVDEYLWLMGRARYKPIIEYCGGTEIGGGFVTGSLQQAQSLAAFSTPAMCCNLFILGEDGHPIPENVPGIGELALGSLMLGASNTLLNADHYGVYFKGMPLWNGKVLRRHGDVFERTARGFYHAHGRADDTMNLGGIKVSSVEIERICNGVDSNIVETAAIGIPPSGGGPEQLAVAVVLKNSNITPQDLQKLKMSFNSALQKTLNPLFRVSQVVPVPSLPRTASNKVMRRVLRQQLAEHNQSSKI